MLPYIKFGFGGITEGGSVKDKGLASMASGAQDALVELCCILYSKNPKSHVLKLSQLAVDHS